MAFEVSQENFEKVLPQLRIFPDLLSVYATVKLWFDGVADECNVRLIGYPKDKPEVWAAVKDNKHGKPFIIIQTTSTDKKLISDAVLETLGFLEDFISSKEILEVVAIVEIMDVVRNYLSATHSYNGLDQPCTWYYMDEAINERLLKNDLKLPEGFEYVDLDGERDGQKLVDELLYAAQEDLDLAKARLEKMPSVGIREIATGNLVSFEYNDGFGFITHQFTYPKYRGMGFGKLVELKTSKLNLERLGIWPYKGVSRNRPRVIAMSDNSPWWIPVKTSDGEPHLVYYTVFSKNKLFQPQIYEN
ncbi:hypothetical protein L596_015548 [Steinernema carpocapsae]|nr:hypothetical protein L596_015548 [Steinernema carpocapsae]